MAYTALNDLSIAYITPLNVAVGDTSEGETSIIFTAQESFGPYSQGAVLANATSADGVVHITGSAGNFTFQENGDYTESGIVVTLKGSDGKTYYYLLSAQSEPKPAVGQHYNITDDRSVYKGPVCFLAGTVIATQNDGIDVEDIEIGTTVATFSNGGTASAPVIWTGRGRVIVRPFLPDDLAGYPVRISRDAIADGVPFKDLLVTPEHCLFLSGKFVPVRMLVNGMTIRYDRSITAYDYYHFETEEHAVVMSDGVLTESYLDTGNRTSFAQDGTFARIGQRCRSWETDAAAPLCVSREFVEPIFDQLKVRAEQECGASFQVSEHLIDQPDIRIMTEDGNICRPSFQDANCVLFDLPGGTQSVRLLSHSSRPCDTIGPFVDDRRSLGVLIGRISLAVGNDIEAFDWHLATPELQGWHAVEDGERRWTNGSGFLPFGKSLPIGTMLKIDVISAGPYLTERHFSENVAA